MNELKESGTSEQRQAREEAWHDQHFKSEEPPPAHYAFNPTDVTYSRLLEVAGNIQGKVVLEYGCGAGWSTAELLSRGGEVVAFDISTSALEEAHAFVEKYGYGERARFMKMPGEKLELPDGSIDIAFGNAILHHLDLPKAIDEMYRVLKPGGRGIFAEPLGTNPLINIYRRFTPQHRTVDEAPLSLTAFRKLLGARFELWHEEYYLLAVAPLALAYIPVLKRLVRPLLGPFLALDRALLAVLPFLGRFAWYSVLVITKRPAGLR